MLYFIFSNLPIKSQLYQNNQGEQTTLKLQLHYPNLGMDDWLPLTKI